jgi:hypothetical protein
LRCARLATAHCKFLPTIDFFDAAFFLVFFAGFTGLSPFPSHSIGGSGIVAPIEGISERKGERDKLLDWCDRGHDSTTLVRARVMAT